MKPARFALLVLPLLTAGQQTAPAPSQAGQRSATEPTRPEDLCSIEGQVLNALTGEPLKKAQIAMDSQERGGDVRYAAATDAAARFEIKGIEPGGTH